jgi:ABC-type transporter Mla subunit MlaD
MVTLEIVLPWLLAASAWRRSIELVDRRLNHLRTRAMSYASLDTFRPIHLLRQYVADLHDALQDLKDGLGETENQAVAQLQTLAQFRLETLDSIFDTLLKQANALSSKASNEIQLVIGSVTIQVSYLSSNYMTSTLMQRRTPTR